MAPICSRTSLFTDAKNSGAGVAGSGPCGGERRWMNAKGRWPLRGSGMPMTLASAIEGCDNIACSIEPSCCCKNFLVSDLLDNVFYNLKEG